MKNSISSFTNETITGFEKFWETIWKNFYWYALPCICMFFSLMNCISQISNHRPEIFIGNVIWTGIVIIFFQIVVIAVAQIAMITIVIICGLPFKAYDLIKQREYALLGIKILALVVAIGSISTTIGLLQDGSRSTPTFTQSEMNWMILHNIGMLLLSCTIILKKNM